MEELKIYFKEEPLEVDNWAQCEIDDYKVSTKELYHRSLVTHDIKPLREMYDNKAKTDGLKKEVENEIMPPCGIDNTFGLHHSIDIPPKDEETKNFGMADLEEKSSKKTHKCYICSYESNREHNVKRHMLGHKNPSEIEMVECAVCQYRTKHKSDLKKHLLNHRNPDEVEMLKCKQCDYTTKHKSYLLKHSLIHKDRSETPMYKCEFCKYETKKKQLLQKHILTHQIKPVPVRELLECEFCHYHTVHVSFLIRHMASHQTHKCDLCGFETRHRHYLKIHKLIHKSPDELIMFRCNICNFEFKRAADLKKHAVGHKRLRVFICGKRELKKLIFASIVACEIAALIASD
ncbi:hypothetical protein JTB14_011599 [Gonioctena quinquepunctata]|nr:hypothetical protein JTB14_011599 [Gonioctena quinquepunctata]